jgi:hypothetical protein
VAMANEAAGTFRKRLSSHAFTPDPVPRATVESLVEAAARCGLDLALGWRPVALAAPGHPAGTEPRRSRMALVEPLVWMDDR